MKKAKIILDKEDVTILTQTNKNEEYFFLPLAYKTK